jgi:inhibitor of cysteine peptidase
MKAPPEERHRRLGEIVKSGQALLLLLLLLIGLAAACGGSSKETAATEVRVTEKEDGQEVRLAKGGSLVVSLASNHTTGYAWTVKEGATPVLSAQFDQRYDAPNTGLIGSGGTEVFSFKAAAAGKQTLKLTYERSFEPLAPPARTFTLNVRVE